MPGPEQASLQQLSDDLASLCGDMVELESSLLKRSPSLHEDNLPSARNLAHYMALRRHDIRKLQSQLARLGLSSLGRTESHVLDAFRTVHGLISRLLEPNTPSPLSAEQPVGMVEGAELLERHTVALLGPSPPGRTVRIMVMMDTGAAANYELVRDLVLSGMDCMRINCAHDNPEAWLGMIKNLQRARQETGRECRILMDLPGPKLRTAPSSPVPRWSGSARSAMTSAMWSDWRASGLPSAPPANPLLPKLRRLSRCPLRSLQSSAWETPCSSATRANRDGPSALPM